MGHSGKRIVYVAYITALNDLRLLVSDSAESESRKVTCAYAYDEGAVDDVGLFRSLRGPATASHAANAYDFLSQP